MNRIPDRWLDYTPIGKQIPDTNFIAFKVPLDERYSDQFTINTLIDHINNNNLKLGLIIDLTNTKKYYNSDNIKKLGIQYKKIFTEGKAIPNKDVCDQFNNTVDEYLKTNNDLIGVHCTHGLNTTGYLICKYMIDILNISPDIAIESFNVSRGHNIERDEYIQSLKIKKKVPSRIKAIQNHLKQIKEEDDKLIREEEERNKKLEEQKRLEQEILEKERIKREKKRLKNNRRIERQKANGTFKTKKEKQNIERFNQMIESIKIKESIDTVVDSKDSKETNIDVIHNITIDRSLRSPVICVLGHVNTGKTKILDKIRNTNVQNKEAGGITQQIGASKIPVNDLFFSDLLFIDTPGHTSFCNLRIRGTSLCDIAILVIDIMHGLESQTIESINILRKNRTPFIIALNKVDILNQWNTVVDNKDLDKLIHFNTLYKNIIVQLGMQGLNAKLYYNNDNMREYVSIVPVSAITGYGIDNLLSHICSLSHERLYKQLMYSENLKATILEIKVLSGFGTVIDVILSNGSLNENDTMIIASINGPIVTQIKSIFIQKDNLYESCKTIKATNACRIVAKDLDQSLVGFPIKIAHNYNEINTCKEELIELLKEYNNIKVSEHGVFIHASSFGAIEALIDLLNSQNIPYAGVNIGLINKHNIIKASTMHNHNPLYAVILAFNIKIDIEIQKLANEHNVRIISADIIYHIFDKYMALYNEYKLKKQQEYKHIMVYPCKLKILPQYIFKTRGPIILGVKVEEGILKKDTVICTEHNGTIVELGKVASIQINNIDIYEAIKDKEVCIKIINIGDSPKMFGRHFTETSVLMSKITRESIDVAKNYFRDELSKNNWRLIINLKTIMNII